MILVFWTCKDIVEAKQVVEILLEEKLIACASMFPVTSMYTWKGKMEKSEEIKVILKTQDDCYGDVQRTILDECSYEMPEIIRVQTDGGYKGYLSWVSQMTDA